jgi:hypothetical protein
MRLPQVIEHSEFEITQTRQGAHAHKLNRLWRDLGYAVGALVAGLTADALGLSAAIWLIAALTFGSGLAAALRMTETLSVRPREHQSTRSPHCHEETQDSGRAALDSGWSVNQANE